MKRGKEHGNYGKINTKRRLRPYEGVYRQFLLHEKFKRQVPVELTYEDFVSVISAGKCFYCETPLIWAEYNFCRSKLRAYQIDRIDSKGSYNKDNCVACCKNCNWAKNAVSVEEFYVWISRAYNSLKRRKLVN